MAKVMNNMLTAIDSKLPTVLQSDVLLASISIFYGLVELVSVTHICLYRIPMVKALHSTQSSHRVDSECLMS